MVILELGLRISGFIILSLQEHRSLQAIKQSGNYRIMCLGESTTYNQYPLFLEEILNRRNMGLRFSVIDSGQVGTDTTAILSQLEANLDKYKPDMVITMMGINDRGIYVSYESSFVSKIKLFYRAFRVYKLVRLLCLHMASKAREVVFNTDKNVKENNEGFKSNFLKVDLKKTSIAQLNVALTEETFKKGIELNPNDERAHISLGWYYHSQGKIPQAIEVFKKVIELNPNNETAYVGLGGNYHKQRKIPQAIEAFKKAIELNPNNERAFVSLGWDYYEHGKISQAEEVLRQAIELNPKNDVAYVGLATMYYENGKENLSEIYAKKAASLRGRYYIPAIINNYHRLKEILDKRRIKLVCVQYPMRNIATLKRIFIEETKGTIVFVDNEKIFKAAVREKGYREYFLDIFGGDFGHCTEKGNRLLAENIANVILKELFEK